MQERMKVRKVNQYSQEMQLCVKEDKMILVFAHSNILLEAAGVEKYITNEIDILKQQSIGTLVVFPLKNSSSIFDRRVLLGYYGVIYNNKLRGCYTKEELIYALDQMKKTDILEIQLHHTKNYILSELIWFLEHIDCRIKYFIHDFYSVCTGGLMLKNDALFCGSGGVCQEKCAGCRYYSQSEAHSEKMRQFLSCFAPRLQMIGPSESTRKLWLSAYGDIINDFVVLPHLDLSVVLENSTEKTHKGLHIAFVGAPAGHKGWREFVNCTEHFSSREQFRFYHFGVPAETTGNWEEIYVNWLDSGDNAMVEALRREEIDVILLLSKCPETYCYTLYESIAAKAWILTLKHSGNIESVVAKNHVGLVFDSLDDMVQYMEDEKRVCEDIKKYDACWKGKKIAMRPSKKILQMISQGKETAIICESTGLRKHYFVSWVYRLKMLKRKLAKQKF